MKKNKSSSLLTASIAAFFVMSASFLFMPIDSDRSGVTFARVFSGLCFWLGLLAGIVTQILLTREIKKELSKRKITLRRKRRIGIVTFLSNRFAALSDAVMILGLILLILSIFLSGVFGYFNYIIWFVFVFSFSMHCILNGKNYYHIKLIQKRSVENEENG